MSEMVERAARAIYEKRNGHGCKPWSIQTKAHKAPYFDDARAAIEAMREPTLDIEAGSWTEGFAGDIWRDHINTALS